MIYLFDKNERLIKIIRKKAIKTIAQKQTLTDTRYVSDRLSVELKALSSNLLDKVEYLAIPTRKDPRKFHLFFLATHETSGNITTLEGTQTGIEELRKVIIEDKKPRNKMLRPVVEELLAGTNWTLGFVTETGFGNTNFYYISVFEALQKACEVWDAEMQFFVEMANNQIGARYIDFKRKLGKKVGTRLVYGTNALALVRQAERTNLITAAIGRGKGEEVSSAEENESGYAGYGRKIQFTDVVWSKAKGHPIDKPAGQNYIELPQATARYGVKRADGMAAKYGIIEIDTDDREELLRRTYEQLLTLSRPQATYKTSAVYLKNVEIGDTIRVVRKDWDLDYETRIFEITWDRLSDKATSITLGDRLNVSENAKAMQLSRQMDDVASQKADDLRKYLYDSLPSADGFNKNWYTDTEPKRNKVKIGDIWYKPDPEHEGEKIMLIWDGENWVEVVRTVGTKAIQEKIDYLEAESEQFEKDFTAGLADVHTKVNQKAEDLKKELETTIHSETQDIKARQTTFEASFQTDKGALTTHLTSVETGLTNLTKQIRQDKAYLEAYLEDVVSQADSTARQAANQLSIARRELSQQADAQKDLTKRLTIVEKLADGTQITTEELTKTLNQAKSDVSSVSKRTKVVEDSLKGQLVKLTETETSLETTKQNQANYEMTTNRKLAELTQSTQTLDGKIATANTKVELTTDGLQQLSTKVTNQEGLITSHTADIKRLNSELSSKVSQTSYDTLTRRVTSTESLIQQQANAINQRLTATQVESAITIKGYQTSSQVNNAITSKGYQTKEDVDSNIAGRGFATATTLDNKVRETVEGYTREISRVERLIPTETTGNLLLNSNVVLKNVESMTYEIAETLVSWRTYTITSRFFQGTGSQGHTGTIKDADGNVIIKNANGTDQYFMLTYNGKVNSWVVTIKPTVDIPKGSRLQLFSHPANSKGRVSFVTMVRGIVPLASWQPHWSEQATVTALNAVKSTADEHTRTLTSLQNDTLKKAEVSITSDKIVLGVGKEINGRTFSTMIAQNSQYVDIIAEKLRVSGNMIVDGTITSKDLAVGSVTAAQIVANSVTADKIATNAVTADKLLADQALFNKLKANQAYLKTLFTTDAFAQTVKTIELNADKITAGTLNAAKTNVINLNASNITSGTMSANLIKGGVLKALNNNTIFDLNNGNITFNTSSSIIFNQSGNALKRTKNGSTAFMHFNDSTAGGVYAGFGVTSHNEGVKSQYTSRFAGVRAFRDNDANDQVEIFGDKIIMGHAFETNAHALLITPTGLKTTVDLIDFMRWCRTEILRLHNVKTTQTTYTYNVWGEF